MSNFNNQYQYFEEYDQDDTLVCHWSMLKITRSENDVWLMNHFFVNPHYNKKLSIILATEMKRALQTAKKSQLPIWPLDPVIIAYFSKHPEFNDYWYHKPASN